MKNKKLRVYIASPFDTSETKANAEQAKQILNNIGFIVFAPWDYKIPQAWDYTNSEWGAMVFSRDILEIDSADFVVVLSYGRNSTAGTNWEAGYAFGKNKKVILIEMNNDIQSLMVANGRYATRKGLAGLKTYNFRSLIKYRTDTEQK